VLTGYAHHWRRAKFDRSKNSFKFVQMLKSRQHHLLTCLLHFAGQKNFV